MQVACSQPSNLCRCVSRRDGQLTFSGKLYNVGVINVRRINRHEAGHAVDVAADASGAQLVIVKILSIGVHDQSSALIAQESIQPPPFTVATALPIATNPEAYKELAVLVPTLPFP